MFTIDCDSIIISLSDSIEIYFPLQYEETCTDKTLTRALSPWVPLATLWQTRHLNRWEIEWKNIIILILKKSLWLWHRSANI